MSNPAPSSPSSRVYLSATAVAKLLGVSAKTISRWSLQDPTMPATRIGRTLRFDEAALHRWLTMKTSKRRRAVRDRAC
jgi:excisionase family DNA binding protein